MPSPWTQTSHPQPHCTTMSLDAAQTHGVQRCTAIHEADAASKHVPAPATRTEVRKEPRALVLIHLLLFHKGNLLTPPGRLLRLLPPVEALKQAFTLFVKQTSGRPLMNLGHWHVHELLRRHLMSAQRGWIEVRTQFRPRVRTLPRTFFPRGKVRKPPCPAPSAAPT